VLRAPGPVTLVGGAGVRAEDLRAALAIAPTVVAADSGAETCLAADVVPALVVGDMDSISAETRAALKDRLHRVAEQDSTDFEKVLRAVEAPLMVGVGFLGGRMDHALAAMSVLIRSPRRCVLVGPHDVVFAAPARVALGLAPGTRVSLFPMAPVAGRSEGLRWPISGIGFAPAGRTGTSNEALGDIALEFEGRGMVVLLPRETLPAVIEGLA
jgi:thiamine pyrophosphokinase